MNTKRAGKCHICGKWGYLDKHHVFGGCYRDKSERYSMVAYICRDCHNAIHFSPKSKEMMETLRREYELKFKRLYPDLDFIETFGRDYLGEAVSEDTYDIGDGLPF